MAEAVAVLGVATAAAQFAEIGFKVVYKCSVLVKESREYPEFLQRTRNHMHNLLSLAKVAAENTSTPEVVTSSDVQPATSNDQQLQSANNQHSVQLEDIWKDCSRQAEIIDTALQSMTREIERGGILGQWKKLRLHPRIHGIEKALSELERCKATLGLYLGNESLYRMGRMHHDVAMTHDKFEHFEGVLSRLFELYHEKTEATILDAIQKAQTSKALGFKANDEPLIQQRNSQHKAPNMVVSHSANQGQNLSKANNSHTGKRRKEIDNSNVVLGYSKRVEWSKMLTLAGNTVVVLELGSQSKKSFKSASEDDKNKFLNVYLRLRTAWFFDLVELNFSLQQYPGAPSLRASLKTLTQVENLPLRSFFTDIYGFRNHERNNWAGGRMPSEAEQVRLFNVARKLLLQNFYAGDASPSFVDRDGRTLLHLQALLYTPRYETLFLKMTEFLVSMGVDTEVADNALKTAQNILRTKIWVYHGYSTQHIFQNGTQLPWTGPLKGRSIVAFHILQCALIWPESILDTEYEDICDIVLRKSIDDLQNLKDQEDLNTVQRRRPISPLHFAAAASWPAGVETLISKGYSRFQKDKRIQNPLNIAIWSECIAAVKIFLRGDCLELFTSYGPNLPSPFLSAAEINDSRIHDIIIECILRHKFLLPRFLPYHDLAGAVGDSTIRFAQKLFDAGFQDIEGYNTTGYTPLMVACERRNLRMASFLLQHGADPYKCYEHVDLRAGHFLHCGNSYLFPRIYPNKDLLKFKDALKKLLEPALDLSIDVGSRCRCSPDGFNPITTLFQTRWVSSGTTYRRKQVLEGLIEIVDPSTPNKKRYWRAFVVAETFTRLRMTHTCLNLPRNLPWDTTRLQLFPDNKRIGIEDEEEELFFELEEIVARFDLFSEGFGDDLSKCVDEFFDDLDGDLLPLSDCDMIPYHVGGDFFGFGEATHYVSSRGQHKMYGYKEIVEEESMLRWLF